jgi:enoyl-CoA hydratase/carnithine racemase
MLQVAERDRIIYLTVAGSVRPGAPSDRLARELRDACVEIEQRDEPVAAVALVARGDAFWLEPPDGAAAIDALGATWDEALLALDRLSPPVVASISGDAIGASWTLALACDLRLAAAGARVGHPEVRWGRLPAAGGTQRIVRVAGPAAATRLLYLGEVLAAPDALQAGLVHRVMPAAELDAGLEAVLDGLRASAPIALAYARETIRAATDLPLAAGLRLEADLAALLQTTDDRAEGIGAFLHRRQPRFEAR